MKVMMMELIDEWTELINTYNSKQNELSVNPAQLQHYDHDMGGSMKVAAGGGNGT